MRCERSRQVGLAQRVARLVERATLLEDPLRLGVACAGCASSGATRPARRTREPSRRQLDGRGERVGPAPAAVLLERELESRARCRARPRIAIPRGCRASACPTRRDTCRARRPPGAVSRKSMKVVPPVGHADQHVAAAAEVPGEGVRDGQGEADGDRRVHGIAARAAGPPRRRRPPWASMATTMPCLARTGSRAPRGATRARTPANAAMRRGVLDMRRVYPAAGRLCEDGRAR